MDNDKQEAVQAVVDRVASYQEAAPPGTVAKELDAALAETDLDVDQADRAALVQAIEADDGPVDVGAVLG